jgi:hypothetical protein
MKRVIGLEEEGGLSPLSKGRPLKTWWPDGPMMETKGAPRMFEFGGISPPRVPQCLSLSGLMFTFCLLCVIKFCEQVNMVMHEHDIIMALCAFVVTVCACM